MIEESSFDTADSADKTLTLYEGRVHVLLN
jgi:hypothetical protein